MVNISLPETARIQRLVQTPLALRGNSPIYPTIKQLVARSAHQIAKGDVLLPYSPNHHTPRISPENGRARAGDLYPLLHYYGIRQGDHIPPPDLDQFVHLRKCSRGKRKKGIIMHSMPARACYNRRTRLSLCDCDVVLPNCFSILGVSRLVHTALFCPFSILLFGNFILVFTRRRQGSSAHDLRRN